MQDPFCTCWRFPHLPHAVFGIRWFDFEFTVVGSRRFGKRFNQEFVVAIRAMSLGHERLVVSPKLVKYPESDDKQCCHQKSRRRRSCPAPFHGCFCHRGSDHYDDCLHDACRTVILGGSCVSCRCCCQSFRIIPALPCN